MKKNQSKGEWLRWGWWCGQISLGRASGLVSSHKHDRHRWVVCKQESESFVTAKEFSNHVLSGRQLAILLHYTDICDLWPPILLTSLQGRYVQPHFIGEETGTGKGKQRAMLTQLPVWDHVSSPARPASHPCSSLCILPPAQTPHGPLLNICDIYATLYVLFAIVWHSRRISSVLMDNVKVIPALCISL